MLGWRSHIWPSVAEISHKVSPCTLGIGDIHATITLNTEMYKTAHAGFGCGFLYMSVGCGSSCTASCC